VKLRKRQDGAYAGEVRQDFLEAYPESFLEDVVRLLLANYPHAEEICQESHAEPEVRDLYPHVRRAVVQGKPLRELANRYGVSASIEQDSKNSHSYTLLTARNVLVTVSAVSHPNQIARSAKYRATYARSAQLKLWGEQPPQSDTLYAILQHGSDPLDRAQLGFAHVVFPDESYSQQVARIDLLDMFSNVVDAHKAKAEASAGGEPVIRLRPSARKSGS
jgi:hypothetical protein